MEGSRALEAGYKGNVIKSLDDWIAQVEAIGEFKHIKVFSPRSLLRREVYESVCNRWKELGFTSVPPKITNFEPHADQHVG